MSTLTRLVNPTNEALHQAFAIHVAGYQRDARHDGYWIPPGERQRLDVYYTANPPAYLTSVDAVLPYLEAWRVEDSPLALRRFAITRIGHDYEVDLRGHGPSPAIHYDASLARALVVALLRAKGVEVWFT